MKKICLKNADMLISIVVATVLYLWIFTAQSLSPSNINLVMKGGDLAQNYLGGALCRTEPFSWDLFATTSLQYPEVSSALQTDSSPLVSFVFKLLRPLGFKAEYQYFGIWILFNCIMTAVFSVLLFRHIFNAKNKLFQKREHLKNTILIVASSVFFIISPIMLNRAFQHINLTAHWIILAALLMYVRNVMQLRTWLYAGLLLFIAFGVHPYFVAMVFPLFMALAIKQLIHKEISATHFLLGFGFLLLVTGACFFGFHLQGGVDFRTGFGWHQANLNTFINPHNNESLFIPPMGNVCGGEWEGAAYLGLGLLLLVAATCWYAVRYGYSHVVRHKEIAIVLLCFTLFAISSSIHWGNIKLLEYRLPHSILDICHKLRSSGRFIWVLWYALAYVAVYCAVTLYKHRVLYIIPVLLLVQIIDLQPLFNTKRDFIRTYSNAEYVNQLQSPQWKELFVEYQHIVLPKFKAKNVRLYNDIWFRAVQYGATVNTGYLTLQKAKNIEQTGKAQQNMEKGELPQLGYKALYILPNDMYERMTSDSSMKNFVQNIRCVGNLQYVVCE